MIEIALVGSLVLNVCFALVILKIALTGLSRLSESHERTTTYTEGLIDRLMANNYSDYQDRQLALAVARTGVADLPDNPEDDFESTHGPDRGGFGSRLGLVALSHNPEEELERELASQQE